MKWLPLIAVAMMVLAGGVGLWWAKHALARQSARAAEINANERDQRVRPFRLTSHTGAIVSDTDLRGRLVLLYFGYTFCPDICPTELGYIARVLKQLGADATQVQPVFVSVDPERDSAKALSEYVPLFDPRLIGLTGSAEDLTALCAAYGVHAQRANVVTKQPGFYLIDHSSTIFLLDRDGRIVERFDSHEPAATTLAAIRRHL